MIDRAIYIGDEATAAGYRLAGLHTSVPASGGESTALEEALSSAMLVLVSSAVAARIDEVRLRTAFAEVSPLVVVVPALDPSAPFPDVAARVRADIGLST